MAKTTTKQSAPPVKFANGWLDQLDGRTGISQVMRERYAELSNDLGGVENLSYQQRSLVERTLWLEYWLARQEQAMANGGDFDIGKWTQGFNSLQGVYAKLGLKRIQREPLNISDYLKSKAEGA